MKNCTEQRGKEEEEAFVKELRDKVYLYSGKGQYKENSPEEEAYQDGVDTACAMMSIELLGFKKNGMLSKFRRQPIAE